MWYKKEGETGPKIEDSVILKRRNHRMKKKDARWKTRLFWGLVIMSSVVCLLNPSKTKTTEAIQSVATHIGTFEGSTTFTTSSRNGINPGLFIEVMDEKGNLTQYESEEGVITIPGTQEGAYVTQAKLLGKTKYIDQDSGAVLDEWEEGRKLELVSVENPKLITTGANLFDKSKAVLGYIYGDSGEFNQAGVHNFTSDFIRAEPNTDYSFYKIGGYQSTLTFSFYDINKKFIGQASTTNTLTSPFNAHYFKIHTQYVESGKVDLETVELSVVRGSDIPTTITPYQSNTITVDEEVVLRGVGKVQDELDLMTGEVATVVKNGLLNGTETWSAIFTESSSYFSTTDFNVVENSEIAYEVLPTGVVDIFVENNKLRVKTTKEFASISASNFVNKLKENPIPFIYGSSEVSTKTLSLTFTYSFKPIQKQDIHINGTLLPLIASITVPSEALLFVLDPNQAEDQQFVAPEFSLTNSNHSPLRVKLKSFEQTTDVLNDVLPNTHADWTQLNQQQSKDIALALVPNPSEDWLSLDEGPRYVAESSNVVLGEIKAQSTVTFTFSALHGRVFSEALNPHYRLTFVFDFN